MSLATGRRSGYNERVCTQPGSHEQDVGAVGRVSVRRSPYQLWYARDEAPIEPQILRAGPLTIELHGPDLRYVRTARNEVVRRVYMAVRDLNWNTLPVVVSEPVVEAGSDEFRVSFDARNAVDGIDFSWHGTIEGTGDGQVSYAVDGIAQSTFMFAKVGLCIHHPPDESAGRLFRGAAPDTPVGGALPQHIGPQITLVDDAWDIPLFDPVEWLEIDMPHGERIHFDFEGDLFEMEDQRNWTDGSFKTVSTPAYLGYRHTIELGGRIRQKVSFQVEGLAPPAPPGRRVQRRTLYIRGKLDVVVPPLGLGSASHGVPPTAAQTALLRALGPSHVRVDVRPGRVERLERGLAEAESIGAGLELALFVNGDRSMVDEVVATLSASSVPLARTLVFADGAETTPLEYVQYVRDRLGGSPVGGGTNVYFNELNRNRPDPEQLDVVAYSINPQVHAFDELSLVEGLAAQYETVRSARAFLGSTPIAVTPITLRPRFNAVATVEESVADGGLPPQVDPRQMSQFAAAWTLGSLKYLAGAGASSLTYFETTGWGGVIERADVEYTEAFPSLPGDPFPLYHVLRDLCRHRGVPIIDCRSSDPLATVGLALGTSAGVVLLAANLTAAPTSLRIEGLSGPARVRPLSHETGPGLRLERWSEDVAVLELSPFEVIRVDPDDGRGSRS
jgi:D-apionolactonase